MDISCLCNRRGSDWTTGLNKVTRADGKIGAKPDNKKETNSDFSADSEGGSTT